MLDMKQALTKVGYCHDLESFYTSTLLTIAIKTRASHTSPSFLISDNDDIIPQALLTTDTRTANVIATSDAVECLTLDRE